MPLQRLLQIDSIKRFLKEYKATEVVFWEGDPAHHFFIIADGHVEIRRRRPDGNPIVLAKLNPGDFFGEMALISKLPRTGTAVALERTRVLVLSQEHLMQLISHDSAFALLMIQRLCERLKKLGDTLVEV